MDKLQSSHSMSIKHPLSVIPLLKIPLTLKCELYKDPSLPAFAILYTDYPIRKSNIFKGVNDWTATDVNLLRKKITVGD